MLKPDSLNSLFSLLEEMTLIQRENGEVRPPAWLSRSEMLTIYGYVVSVVCVLIAAGIQRTWPSPIHSLSLELAYLAMVLFGLAYMLMATLSVGTFFWRHRKKRLAVHLARLKIDMLADRSFLMQLLKYDKATLEYGQMQYKHTWVKFDTRIGLIIGDLRKLGLFPALTASSMAASTLLKNDSNIYLWMPLVLAASFYFVGFYAQGRQERCLQVSDLLDYAIRHANTSCDSAPVSRKVTKSR